MDPKIFVRLSVGQLGLKLPGANTRKAARSFHCEIRLRGFPVQTAPVPLINSSEFNLDPHTNAAVFSLDESDLKALSAPGCFGTHGSYLEVAVYVGRRGGHCGIVTGMKMLVGVVRMDIGPEWRDGKPVMLHLGWVGIGKGDAKPELHLRVKMEADPRYIFEFDDEVALNPQVVQLHGRIRQPIFSCKFFRDRRASQGDQLGGPYWSSSGGEEKEAAEMMMRRRERKGWKVVIHDLSGSAVAAAFMATPFVAASGCDTVARSNPGAWLIARAGVTSASSAPPAAESWQPWSRLEAWRDQGGGAASGKDTVCLRLRLLPDGQDDACMLVSETPLRSDRGGEFTIDMDRQAAATEYEAACGVGVGGGFVMSCRVDGEARSSRPVVQLAMRHVACMEDAAMFVALAAAVDLSVKACRPFRRKTTAAAAARKKKTAAASASSSPDPLELDT